jgi:hypothetical protein
LPQRAPRGGKRRALSNQLLSMQIDIISELQEALMAIDWTYCQLSTLGYSEGAFSSQYERKYLERPVAYELYHQLRLRMARWPTSSLLRLQGEVDKRYQGIINAQCAPDLLIHRPNANESNLVVVEIKMAERGLTEIVADQAKLRRFVNPPLDYSFGVQILVGETQKLAQVVNGLRATRCDPRREIILAANVEQKHVARF